MSTAPYVKDSATSEEAAKSIADDLGRLEKLVYGHIEEAGLKGATDDELEEITGLSHQTVSARRRTLVLKGMVCDSGQRRSTRSNRKAVVWVIGTDPGAEEGDARGMVARPSDQDLEDAILMLDYLEGVKKFRVAGLRQTAGYERVKAWLRFLVRKD